jgi:pimeloyl-ACP methyl ester carboxylesterase
VFGFKTFVYKTLKLPYALHVAVDEGSGQPVIFLHGIASSSKTWDTTLPLLQDLPVRCIAIDLLGFGSSPSPDWPEYNLHDHAKSVARTIVKLRLKQKPIIVGHSMGSLIATELAYSYPRLVKQLILCSVPLYGAEDFDDSGLNESKPSKRLNNMYFSIYEKLIEKRDFTLQGAKQLEALSKDTDLELNENNWGSFTKSLKNAIIAQDTVGKLEKLQIKTQILYGTFDVLLISKYYSLLVKANANISVTGIAATHTINKRYAKAICASICASVTSS